MTNSALLHLAFDRGRILARGASGTRLPQKILPAAKRRCGDFLERHSHWPWLLKRGKFASAKAE
jgi:hypothetical protein